MIRKQTLNQSGRCAQTNQKNVKMPSGDYNGVRGECMRTTAVELQLPESGRSESQVIAIVVTKEAER
jgi:hypothetical protein